MNLLLDLPEQKAEAALEHFRALHGDPDSPVRAIHHQPPRVAQCVSFPRSLDPRLTAALETLGIRQLYVHQSEAFERALAGENIVVVTPTASGKTLCYNLPVLHGLLADPDQRALYLFPTKALAVDQLAALHDLAAPLGGAATAFTYDGDTPQDARRSIRERASLVLTNPDMLHSGILPHHTKWAKCFERLKWVVVDELHACRGVYGSHVANVLRRLKRICAFYGSSPRFIASSATIANPRELAEALAGEPFTLIDSNGAPSGEKYFVFYNPPVVNRELGIRRSYLHESRRVAGEFIRRGQQTLVFANSRLATELLITYLKSDTERGPAGGETVRGYRGGYLPRERREIERKLRDGAIRAVVATNALELGIDVGSLDAVVMAGYPGSIASSWQRAGRAGRRQSTAVSVLVASSSPLDQYIVEHPDYFFGSSPEHARIHADNLEILLSHLKCAAFELPLAGDETLGAQPVAPLCRFLEELGFVHHSGGAWHWTSDSYPADAVSLRAVTSDNFVVVDTTGEPEVIAEVDFPTALVELHEKAIYLHEARQYQVERFDYANRKAYVRRVECDYFTNAIEYTQVAEMRRFEESAIGGAGAIHGEVRVNRQVVGFKKVKLFTMENVGSGKLMMPEQEMHTTAFWLHFPPAFLAALGPASPVEKQSGLIGLGAALRAVGALHAMCDPRDLGAALNGDVNSGAAYEPDLFLYDVYPGGVGLSAPLHAMAPRLFGAAHALIADCRCEAGCPSCVGPIGEVGEGGKAMALRILAQLTTAGTPALVK